MAARRSSCRFLAWYRIAPMLCVAVMGIVCAGFSYAPAPLLRFMYPLSYEQEILNASVTYGLDPYLVAAVIETESGWNADAKSNRGACGLMQLMPETSQDMVSLGLVDGDIFDPQNLSDPVTNIEFGCAYLSYLIRYFNGSTDKAIAAYNAGMGNVEQWSQKNTSLHNAITFPETQAYLVRVMSARERYQSLYPNSFS